LKSNVNISSYDKLVEEYIKTKAELEETKKKLEKLEKKCQTTPKKEKFYVVIVGRKPGIYTSWNECKKYVRKYAGAQFKSFKTLEEAEKYFKEKSNPVKIIKADTKNHKN